MREYHRTQANIDLSAIRQNVLHAKKRLASGTKIMAVIKADAYGHGAVAVAEEIDELVDAYGVAIPEEGVELRQAGFTKPILILGFTPQEQYETMLIYDLTAAIFHLDMAKKLSDTAVRLHKTAKLHIKLDTGMNRIGFSLDDQSLKEIKAIAKLPAIRIEGCFSHFARMDEADKTHARKQFRKFCAFTERIESCGIELPIKHISNSAGIIDAEEVNLDMVRLGISLYGIYPSQEVQKEHLPLIPAMEWKAKVSYVKELAAGEEIGYGGTYTTAGRTMVATIPVGYADGYPRSLSNRGRVLIHGQSAPIIGRICMDQFMVDVTGIPSVQEKDVVTLFGRDGEQEITVEEISERAYSFRYEFVCDVGKRVPRVFFRDGKKAGTKDYYPEYE